MIFFQLINAVITFVMVIASLLTFLWVTIGILPGFYFLFKFMTSKQAEARQKALKRMLLSWGGVPLLFLLAAFYAVVTLVFAFLGVEQAMIP